jgi:hypothetical protein
MRLGPMRLGPMRLGPMRLGPMRRAFEAYQYIAPAVLTPLCAWLWWRHYDGNAALAAIALLVPIAHAYWVPAIGTNALRVWEIDTRLRLGRFRPHHGFVFGSATALLLLPALGAPATDPTAAEVIRTGMLAGCILAPVNLIYDALAIRAGILKVYNQPWAQGRSAWAIAADYAPWFFGGFGLIHGAGLKLAEAYLLTNPDPLRALAVGSGLIALTATLPTLGYVIQSYWRHGHHGCRPIPPQAGE